MEKDYCPGFNSKDTAVKLVSNFTCCKVAIDVNWVAFFEFSQSCLITTVSHEPRKSATEQTLFTKFVHIYWVC